MENVKKKKKKLPFVLLALVIIIGALAALIYVNGSRNMKVMNSTVDAGLAVLSEHTEVTELDPGEYGQIKLYGLMKFDVDHYDVREIGNLSVMKVNMGFMQMVSFVLTPYDKDMPLLSMDFMYIMGKRKSYVEFYDLVRDVSAPEYKVVLSHLSEFEEMYAGFEDIETEPAWYDDLLTVALHKAGKRRDDEEIKIMFMNAIDTYMKAAAPNGELDSASKAEKLGIIQEYSDNLISKGGVSTDVFKKALGEETTKDFFDKVFFGTELHR